MRSAIRQDKRVLSGMLAMVPSMCDHTGVLAGRCSGGPKWIKLSDGRPVNLAVVKMAPYYDMVNFSRRIKAATYFNVGFVDVTTPPSSIYAAYNVIKAPKRITNCPHSGGIRLGSHEFADRPNGRQSGPSQDVDPGRTKSETYDRAFSRVSRYDPTSTSVTIGPPRKQTSLY